ncbi:MAG: hypothetical protein Q4E67_01885, partial [Planctomycetia bacterium]|nr:hypothetical protein [Planctomycetia bacterium]
PEFLFNPIDNPDGCFGRRGLERITLSLERFPLHGGSVLTGKPLSALAVSRAAPGAIDRFQTVFSFSNLLGLEWKSLYLMIRLEVVIFTKKKEKEDETKVQFPGMVAGNVGLYLPDGELRGNGCGRLVYV